MALHNLARVTSATSGTGTFTLGSAVSGFLSFADAGVVNGEIVTYAVRDGANSEIGHGTYTASGTTLSRDMVYESTNGGNNINCSGSQEVFITVAAENFASVAVRVRRASGNVSINSSSYTAIAFTTEDYDTDAFHDNSTNNTRLTVPTNRAGYYAIDACGFTDIASYAVIYVNANPIAIGGSTSNGAVLSAFSVSTDYLLADGDYVTLQVKTQSGNGSVVYDPVSPVLSMHRIGG